ncbi:hypothetical protein ACFSJY_14980 [Thalassotalea euphylliae]|uniref:hypothetical protein n=1 Tax=Thalassotalea euphylliae TaxID=1655234 RepID=UPI003641CBFC
MKFMTTTLAAVCLFSACAANANSPWTVELTPYIWAAANKGSTGAFIETDSGERFESVTDVDISFQDLADHLEVGTMFNLSAHNGDWLLFTEFTYLKVTDDQSVASGPTGNVDVDGELEIKGSLWDAGVGYRLFETQNVIGFGYVGARYLDLEADLALVSDLGGTITQTTVGDDFVDMFVGVHMQYNFNNGLRLQGRAEVGGFDDEPSENQMVNITLHHQLSRQWSMKYFYRYMTIDYADNGFIYDMEVSGPGIGITYLFD